LTNIQKYGKIYSQREKEKKMEKAIYFDMDGTIADFYGVEGWLDDLIAGHTRPYREAKSLVDMRKLGKLLNTLQGEGWHIGIISWLSKSGTDEYNERVTEVKRKWLAKHLGAVKFDELNIVKYGTPKQKAVKFPLGILFDDEKPNRENWTGTAYDVNNILSVLADLL
jgi:hypothetical protein